MAFWPFWQPSSNKLAIFIISCIVLFMLFVENKFFFLIDDVGVVCGDWLAVVSVVSAQLALSFCRQHANGD